MATCVELGLEPGLASIRLSRFLDSGFLDHPIHYRQKDPIRP
eukprot:CAMPEP_0175128702 /NCGR_PEP_ID=MMETSP0087-20121206/5073_1 /TAXON_ID=136419 /ORGANISM="Unknown Unknown, Strain D1" /LENGTH=41 /DNA_ID= /DNA_START= /DNA_END= /DNA_ORIENTATION=